MFSSSEKSSEADSLDSSSGYKKSRRMTYDFSFEPKRARNSISKDPMFQLMNQQEIVFDLDF